MVFLTQSYLLNDTVAMWVETIFGLSDEISREKLVIIEVVYWIQVL